VLGKNIGAEANADQSYTLNGVLPEFGNGALPIGVNALYIGSDATGAAQFNGYISRVALWPTTRQPNSILQNLTTTASNDNDPLIDGATGHGFATANDNWPWRDVPKRRVSGGGR
jgi:hypothetical protein